MCVIKDICNIFFSSTNISIMVLDKELNSLYEVGHTLDSSILITSMDMKNTLSKDNPACNCILLNEIQCTVAAYIKRYVQEMEILYFVIGPISLSPTLNFCDVPCKSRECISYLSKFLSLIFDNVMENYSKKYSPCVKQAIEIVHKCYAENISIDTICNQINISKSYFCNIFKKETGHSFITYLNLYRIENSKQYLKNTNNSVLDISLAMGYQSQSYFCRSFKKHVGMSPLEYRTQ